MHMHGNLVVPLRRRALSVAISATTLALMSTSVIAQQNESSAPPKTIEEVTVTGTLIRGIEPTGSVPIGIDSEAIAATGATTTNELLATVPQVTNFFNTRAELDPRGAAQTGINRPNLRNLPGFNSASGSTTLILVDGHRITPIGLDQASIDPDIIPGAVIERVEIITDGGSSLYGADAVGGVMNFITKKEMEGAKIDVSYGTGDAYESYDLAVSGGTSWDGGSALVSVSHVERDSILNRDRDWARRGQWTASGIEPDDTECIVPVGAITTYFNYGGTPTTWTSNPAAPGAGVTPVGDPCAAKDASSLAPAQERENLWLSISQDLNDNVSFNMQSYYSERTTTYESYPLGDTISGVSPATAQIPGNPGDLYDVAAVGFSYGASPAYKHRDQEIEFSTWGFSPEFIIDMDSGWQLRQTFHYGRSETSIVAPGSNREKLDQYYNANQLDPLNIAAADPAVIKDITNWEYGAKTIQEMFMARAIADGAVMELPAGEMRMAIGAEYTQDTARKKQGETVIGGLGNIDASHNSRDIKAFFAEVQVPVLESLDVSFSVRNDDYSDFGNTTNPNVGFTFRPIDRLSFFGHWGESFNAPTAVDGLSQATIRNLTFGTASTVPDPLGVRDPGRTNVLQITGASAGTLLPQTAETWAFGFEAEPIDGLKFGVTYYDIKFEQILGAPNPQLESAVLAEPDKFIFNPTQAEVDSFLAIVDNADQYQNIDVNQLGIIVDRRTTNTDQAVLQGFDLAVSYEHDTRIGLMHYGLSGNYQSKFEINNGDGWVDNLDEGVSDLALSANVGWLYGAWQARATFNYTNGFDTSTAAQGQTKVDDFLVTNLFVAYEVDDSLTLRFNIDNAFDEDPPVWKQSGDNLPYAGFTMGRIFKFGISKSFF
ncbi:TonB-dependent receptor domain-containing protein [Pseudomaricurvus sp. HS19]|uniref:TonB-dependent receptor domain-containing protein n=1 Tax=Pseudomaricurvus sp. HS19 TaxID=2692626 RepID=UPI00136EFB32|nr:TonB-dependent receptor [Pseudomaricurvus sp. HS19]MYM62359.1 TonB-dependent receptor [Pseudomaricurvus sp. HS19]